MATPQPGPPAQPVPPAAPGLAFAHDALPHEHGCDTSDGGRVGVVISHGFTGTPASMRPWADHLVEAGYSVRLPLLPGHGTSWQDMNTTRWRDWYKVVDAAYADLQRTCDQVFAFGLSMGGTLVTKLAEDHGDELAGVVVVNPIYGTRRRDARFARPLAKVIASRPGGIGSDIKALADGTSPGAPTEDAYGRFPLRAFVSLQDLWKVVVPGLPTITAPMLVYKSRVDHVVDDRSLEILRAGAIHTDLQVEYLDNSWHVATMDHDAQTIFRGSVDFVRARSSRQATTSPADA